MSETPRNYSPGVGFKIARRRRSQRVRRAVLAVCGVALVYAFWISRDTHSIAEFIPGNRRLEVVVPRANVARHRFVESAVWRGIPASWAGGWPEALADTRGLPDWVVGNIAGNAAVAVADDLNDWSDYMVVSQMTRVGCLIERALRFSPSNSSEWAGGLWIRYWKPGDIHYAVRGRALLVSPSRERLVNALTLTPERRAGTETLRAALTNAGAEDARGTIRFSEDEPLGRAFSELRFAARTEADEAIVKLRATFRPHVSDDLQAYWADTEPVPLTPAFAAPVTLSGNLGTNVEESWRVLSELLNVSWLTAERWEEWRADEEGRSAPALLTALLGPMGTSFRVAWRGTDMLEMAPTPILVGSIAGSRSMVDDVLASLPEADNAVTADARVLFDPETARVEAPLMSGPSMSPVGTWNGDTLFFSTSATAADAFFQSGRLQTHDIPKPGNLYLRIEPVDAMEELVVVGEDLASSDLLRGYSAESFREASVTWLERARALSSIEALASVNHVQVDAEWRITCAARPASD